MQPTDETNKSEVLLRADSMLANEHQKSKYEVMIPEDSGSYKYNGSLIISEDGQQLMQSVVKAMDQK